MRFYEVVSEDGTPLVLLHVNLATGRFYEQPMANAPAALRLVAPKPSAVFGRTERVPIDATKGLQDWADDTATLVGTLGITAPVHLAGWSTGGAAIAAYAMDRPTQWHPSPSSTRCHPFGYGDTLGATSAPRQHPTLPVPGAATAIPTSPPSSPRVTIHRFGPVTPQRPAFLLLVAELHRRS